MYQFMRTDTRSTDFRRGSLRGSPVVSSNRAFFMLHSLKDLMIGKRNAN